MFNFKSARIKMMKKIMMTLGLLVLALILIFVTLIYVSPGTIYNAGVAGECRKAKLSEKTIEAAGHTLSYLEGGEGETLILVHGYTADKYNWPRLARYLTTKYHVIAIDVPGFGRTSMHENQSYDIATQAERLNEIFNALQLKKFHLAGNSMGGCISAKYAFNHPDRLLSLGLVNSGCICNAEKSKMEEMFEKGENPFDINTYEDYEKMLEMVFVKAPVMPTFIKRYMFENINAHQATNKKILEDMKANWYCIDKESGKIQVNTFIIWGDQDNFCHVSSVKILEDKFPNHHSVILQNCGHAPMFERPEEMAAHYLKFLENL